MSSVPATPAARAPLKPLDQALVELLARAASHAPLQRLLAVWVPAVEALPEARRVRWSIDVDPVELF